MALTRKSANPYSPLYFLSSVGAGGLAVTFFMYLMFWVPHKDRPVPTFEDIAAALNTGGILQQASIAISLVGIAYFVFLNIKALVWNFSALKEFKQSGAYTEFAKSNAQSALLAAPLAAGMSINAMFIAGLVFVPQLWSVVEYLFPFAMAAFVLNGVWALSLIGQFLGRAITNKGAFDQDANNAFSQALPAFALAMTAVGLSAPAAMSVTKEVVSLSLMLSTLFGSIAVIYALVAIVSAIPSILRNGVAREAAPTLMIVVPLTTILGIMILRQDHALHTVFGEHLTNTATMMFLAKALTLQIAFLLLGLTVLRAQDYFKDFVMGEKTSVGSYALVCPGVALSVMIHFFVNKGLVAADVITKYGTIYWSLTAVALVSQALMVLLVLRLNRQHFSKVNVAKVVAAG